MIEANNLIFQFNAHTTIFDAFSFRVEAGESWSIIGPSGCGKTTLLYLIAGLRQPTSGVISIQGQTIERPRPETGLILQDFGLLPWATVQQNVELGLRIRRFYGPDGRHTPRDFNLINDKHAHTQHWLTRLGIEEQAEKYPNQISGGQRQRTAIARTLVLEPDLLLMDEPFSSLDALTREGLQNVVLDLHREMHITVMLVTHNIEEAVLLGKRILVLGDPPNDTPLVIENNAMITPDYRSSNAFVEQCNQLRILLGLTT